MNLKMTVAILLLLLVGVLPAISKSVTKASTSSSKDEIQKVLDMQTAAWNKGDLATFMTGYLKSPDTSYTSGGVEVWGYDAIHARYAKHYGTDSSAMGKLKFANLRIVEVTKDSAFCVGHFHLDKPDASTADGVFSLVLKKTASGWKIVHDHTTAKKD